MVERTLVRTFYGALYGDEGICDERRLVLWSPGKVSNDWCESLGEAVDLTCKRGAKQDTYFVACLQSQAAMEEEAKKRKDKPTPGIRRGYEQSAALMPALWLDIDWADPTHKKKNLPPTQKHAQYVIDSMPAPASIVVKTGGGLHAWWILKDPLELNTPEERKRARELSYKWSFLARGICEDRGWAMDSVWDLARVMRCPGTLNHKKDEPRPVEMLHIDADHPHDMDGLEVLMPTECVAPVASAVVSTDDYKFELRADAEPPADKIMALCEMDAAFKRVWAREAGLSSQSEYDLSIASRMAALGFNDQEIVNAMVAHRRSHKQPEKLRHDYYAMRLAKVRKTDPDIADGLERLAEVGAEIAMGATIPDERREEIKNDLTRMMALPAGKEIQRIEKYPGDPPTFALLTKDDRITLGTVACITNSNSFRNAVAASTGHLVKRFKAGAWDNIAQAILHAAELIDLGPDATMDGEVHDWLRTYLEDEPPNVSRDEGCAARVPFTHNGTIYVMLQSLRGWLRLTQDLRIEKRPLAARLKSAGCTGKPVKYQTAAGAGTSRYCFAIPTFPGKGSAVEAPHG